MPDYKAMYFHLAGQMSIAIEALEGLVAISERLKKAQQLTEDMFLDSDEDADEFEVKDDEEPDEENDEEN